MATLDADDFTVKTFYADYFSYKGFPLDVGDAQKYASRLCELKLTVSENISNQANRVYNRNIYINFT